MNKNTLQCQCDQEGLLNRAMAHWYDPETELPFVDHQPGGCRCTNELKQYRREDQVLWLCSCCHLSGDVLVEGAAEAVVEGGAR